MLYVLVGAVVSLYVPKGEGFSSPLGSRVPKISTDKGPRGSSSLLELGERARDPRRLQSHRREWPFEWS